MKKLSFLILTLFLFVSSAAAQSAIRMKMAYGSDNVDLMSLLYFEDIGFGKMMFAGEDLKSKNYQISIRGFAGGSPGRSRRSQSPSLARCSKDRRRTSPAMCISATFRISGL